MDEVDALYSQPTPRRGLSPGTAQGGKKWQPLTSIAPNPEAGDHDPFSLDDSDEEQDKKQDLKPEDTERLKQTASASGLGKKEGDLQPTDLTGTANHTNKEAEEILTGDKS